MAPDLWDQFAQASNLKDFCRAWLMLQCGMLKGIRSALVLLGPPDRGPFTPAAIWPTAEFNVQHLVGSAERALKERRGFLVQSADLNPENAVENYHLAYPLEISGKVHGVVLLEVLPTSAEAMQGIMRRLHWGAGWLEAILRRTEAQRAKDASEGMRLILDLLVSVVEQERFQPAAMALVTQLAIRLECDRVSLGFEEGKKLRVKALSHSAEVGQHMNLVRAIASAMDEAIDQQSPIVFPSPQGTTPLVMRSHTELARQQGTGAICTVPLSTDGKFLGGLTFERRDEKPFEPDTVELCETLAALVGPILEAKRREERLLIVKAADSFRVQVKKLIGPGHLALKLVSIVILASVIFFTQAKGTFRVTSPVNLEGTVQRVVSAPFPGYIAEARARHGDVVRKGDLLCLLDERDLKLERVKWQMQREQLMKQYHEAMAKHERAQGEMARAKVDQAEAQIALVDEQLARAKVAAPFDGVIVKGDLSQSLGAPVERGQVLFEVAPLESYRVIVQVDERDIGHVAVSQKGDLLLPSLPGEKFPFTVEKITPVSSAREGRNYFRVEAHLDNVSPRLRPGMEGVGKIPVDERRLIWIWTHDLIEWMQMWLWTWRP